jgi:hypothetical protein
MIELHEEADGLILTIKISGKLTREDYRQFLPEVERLAKMRGTIRVLCHIHDFHGWNVGALWEDVRCDARHFADIERLALIADRKWQAGMTVFCHPFGEARQVRYFDHDESDQAAEWVRTELAMAAPSQPAAS